MRAWMAADSFLTARDAKRALTLLQTAAWCVSADRLVLAGDQLDSALALLPRNEALFGMRGDVFLRRAQFAAALHDFECVLTLTPRGTLPSWRIVYRKGLALLGQIFVSRALAAFVRAIELARLANASREQVDELALCAVRCAEHQARTVTSAELVAFVNSHRQRVNTDVPLPAPQRGVNAAAARLAVQAATPTPAAPAAPAGPAPVPFGTSFHNAAAAAKASVTFGTTFSMIEAPAPKMGESQPPPSSSEATRSTADDFPQQQQAPLDAPATVAAEVEASAEASAAAAAAAAASDTVLTKILTTNGSSAVTLQFAQRDMSVVASSVRAVSSEQAATIERAQVPFAPAVTERRHSESAGAASASVALRNFVPERLLALAAQDIALLHQEAQTTYLCIVKSVGAAALEQASAHTLIEARMLDGPHDGGVGLVRQCLITTELEVVHGDSRKALSLLELLLEALPTQREALFVAVRIHLGAGRYGRTLELVRRGVAAYPKEPLFHIYMGDVLSQLRNYRGALKSFREALKLMTDDPREILLTQIRPGDGKPTALQLVDVQLRVAQAMYGLGERPAACKKLTDIVQAHPNHCGALLAAAKGLFDSGKRTEAMRVCMNALIASPNDIAARQAVTDAICAPGGVELVRRELTQSPSLGAAYEFLGGVVLENGGVEAASTLFRISLDSGVGRVSAILPLAHALELAQKHEEMIRDIASFMRQNKSMAVGAVTARSVTYHLKPLMDVLSHGLAVKWPVQAALGSIPPVTATAAAAPHDQNQIKFLALNLLLYKVLFLRGRMTTMVGLDAVLCDVLGQHSYLAHPAILEEAAEFRYIHALLTVPDYIGEADFNHAADVAHALPLPPPPPRPIYVIGDSHVLTLAWRTVIFHGRAWRFEPIYVRGSALWRVRPGHALRPSFESAAMRIPEGAHVIVICGTQDAEIGLLDFVRTCRFDTIEASAQGACDIFLELMMRFVRERRWRLAVHDVPNLNLNKATVQMLNDTLTTKVAELNEPNLGMLNLNALLSDGDNVRKSMRLDGAHLHPAYCGVVAAALSEMWPEASLPPPELHAPKADANVVVVVPSKQVSNTASNSSSSGSGGPKTAAAKKK